MKTEKVSRFSGKLTVKLDEENHRILVKRADGCLMQLDFGVLADGKTEGLFYQGKPVSIEEAGDMIMDLVRFPPPTIV